MTALAILLLMAVAYRVMSTDERVRLRAGAVQSVRDVRVAVARIRPCEPFRSNLRERTPRVFVTPALLLLTFVLSIGADVQSLGNFGPSTTNGEWWRLVTAAFVHVGVLHLFVNLIGLLQPALLLERLVGHSSLAVVFVTAAITSGLSGLAENPVGMNAGASGAVFGIYGLLAAAITAGVVRRSSMTIPLLAVKRLVPAGALFVIYNVAAGPSTAANVIGFATGLACGGVLAPGLAEGKPPIRRVAAAVAATLVLAIGSAFSIGAIADVRPELARVLAIEERTAAAYGAALDGFRKGRVQAEALVKLIDQSIVPELQAASERLTALEDVPPQQKPLVAHAEHYLRLRGESWRLRAEGLRRTNMLSLRQAERTERESLTALEKIKTAGRVPDPE